MKTTLQITIEDLEKIIEDAKMLRRHDSSLSSTIELSVLKSCDTHTGSDLVSSTLKSGYAECVGKCIYFNSK